MLVKILIVGAIAIGTMAAIKDGRVLRDAGLLSHCSVLSVDGRAVTNEMNCSKGRLDGFPDLTDKSCKVVAANAGNQVWRCAAPVVSSPSPNG